MSMSEKVVKERLIGDVAGNPNSDAEISATIIGLQSEIEGTSGDVIEANSLKPVMIGSGSVTVEDGGTDAKGTVTAEAGIPSANESRSGLIIFNLRSVKRRERHSNRKAA